MNRFDRPIPKAASHVEREHVPTSVDNQYHAVARLCGIASTSPFHDRTSTFRSIPEYEACSRAIDRNTRQIRMNPDVQILVCGESITYTIDFDHTIGIVFGIAPDGHVGILKSSSMAIVIKQPDDPTSDLIASTFYPVSNDKIKRSRDLSKELMTTAEFKALHNPAERVRALSVVTPTAPVLAYDPVKDVAFVKCADGRLETDGARVAFRYPNGHRYAATNTDAKIWQNPMVCGIRDELLTLNTKANPSKPRPSAAVPHEVDTNHPHHTAHDFER